MTPKQILEGAYHRVVVPDGDGFFSAEISEFPGCVAVGESAVEALTNLEEVAESWLESTIANGQAIPLPEEAPEYSGKFVVRLPKSLHARVAHAANRDGVSLNAYISTAIAHYSGVSEATHAPSNIVNLITPGPNYFTQQNLILGLAGAVPAYQEPFATTLGLTANTGWRRSNG